ncbi:MAG: hypothetical protein IPJ06_04915 [Saprospiraceae bacterium]|nr:hypothetical protein [Saprospiraceae bacterium]
MLFKDKLDDIAKKLAPEFDKLFERVIETQTHDGDLLLFVENGLYNPEVHTWNNLKEKTSPYMFGPSNEGHSWITHYKFIHAYRTNAVTDVSFEEYLEKIEYSQERKDEINFLKENEGQSIQLEMLVYLKIWEADAFIKRFYQIARIANKEDYDWHFKISESTRDINATGNRQTIIRKNIRDKFKNDFPILYEAFKASYNTQLRNSIAHSKYSILGEIFT